MTSKLVTYYRYNKMFQEKITLQHLGLLHAMVPMHTKNDLISVNQF